jgi:hypothetical protein
MCVQLKDILRQECKSKKYVRCFVSALVYFALNGINNTYILAALIFEKVYYWYCY